MPYWAALLSYNHINKKRTKKRVVSIERLFTTKDEALQYAIAKGLTKPAAVPSGRAVSAVTVSV